MKKLTYRSVRRWTGLALSMALMFSGVALAAKGGKGGGGKGGGEVTPAKVTFSEEAGNRISGDGGGAYVHEVGGVEAYLGTGGAEGDIFLRLASAPGRGLWFDFGGCYPDPDACDAPFAAALDYASAIAVAPGDVVASGNGLFGVGPGETIQAPMEFVYDFGGPQGPGFVYFDRELKGKNPCKNKSLFATITRPGAAELWTVSADVTTMACVTLPGGDLSGQYDMTFEFTIETLP